MSAEASLQHRFKRFIASYKSQILDGDYDTASDPRYQQSVAAHIVTAQELWELVSHIGLHNAATSTDTIDDLPTQTLEMLRLPYLLGDLWSRVQGADADEDEEDDDPSALSATARRRKRKVQQMVSSSVTAAAAISGATFDGTVSPLPNFSSLSRAEALTKSQRWFEVLLRMVVDLELMQAKDIEIHLGNIFEEGILNDYGDAGAAEDGSTTQQGSTRVMNHAIASRTAKIQLAQHQRDIGKVLTQAENEMAFRRARAARMRRLEREDDTDNNSRSSESDQDCDGNGERDESEIVNALLRKSKVDTETGRAKDFSSNERRRSRRLCGVMEVGGTRDDMEDEDDDENEEKRRMVAVLYLKWCTGEAIQTVVMSNRELEMVSRLSPETRRRIAKEYQENIDLWESRRNDKGRQTYTILPGGMIAPGDAPMHSSTFGTNYLNYREQVRAELMVDRNRPTMTLEEYAAMEMAGIAEQQAKANQRSKEMAEENDRLGDEGIEERERQKQAEQDDWRDDHPAYGITNKGNYS